MNIYTCLYNSEEVSVSAETTKAAQDKALVLYQRKYPRRKIKPHHITPYLIQKDGEPVELLPQLL